MLGAIAGDVIGSVYENNPVKGLEFPLFSEDSRFTDDTVLTVALADCLLHGGDYGEYMSLYAKRFPDAGFSRATLSRLLGGGTGLPDSYGNGAAMRSSPIGWAFDDENKIVEEAEKSARPTHRHDEGIKGARAVALGVFWARKGVSGEEFLSLMSEWTGYELKRSLEEIRPSHRFDATAPGSVPEAIRAFFEAEGFEEAVCYAVSLGGDADTQACIAGALAEARFKTVPEQIASEVRKRLPAEFLEIVDAFEKKWGP
ncbi:MAG: ADP-ribosylglycohydrolase family protein [Thermovirgaceae bacterium]